MTSGAGATPRPRALAYFAALVAVNVMWAFQFSGAKIATKRLGPIAVTLLPLALSTALLGPLVLLRPRNSPGGAIRRSPVRFATAGLPGVVAAQLGLTWGVQKSHASNAAVLNLTIPVLTALMAAAMLGERMTRVRWFSFLLAIAGVVIVSDVDWGSVEVFRSEYAAGNLLIFASCLGSAFYNTYSKRLLETFSPAEVLLYSFVAADAALLGLMLVVERWSLARLGSLGWDAWLSLAAIALFSLTASMLLFFWVIHRITVTQASLSIYLLPVFGVLISTVTVGERLTWRLVAGGALVVASTFLVTTWEERRKARPAATPLRASSYAKD
jgi:drug/metabolite transporter (DMT)-like permease